jgi:hypothetical protein
MNKFKCLIKGVLASLLTVVGGALFIFFLDHIGKMGIAWAATYGFTVDNAISACLAIILFALFSLMYYLGACSKDEEERKIRKD